MYMSSSGVCMSWTMEDSILFAVTLLQTCNGLLCCNAAQGTFRRVSHVNNRCGVVCSAGLGAPSDVDWHWRLRVLFCS